MAYFSIATMLSMVTIVSGESSNAFMQKLKVLQTTGEFRESALQKAGEWFQKFQSHQDPTGEEAGMAELKATNPEAYAVVNALLTKKSLGLLNSRHPTASMDASDASQDAPVETPKAAPQAVFTAPQAPVETPKAAPLAVFTAPEVLAAVPEAASVPEIHLPEVPFPSMATPKHHDFLNWKPANDDEVVSNVLGMVAGLTGRHAPEPSQSSASPVEIENPPAQAPAVEIENPPAPPQVQPEAQIKLEPETPVQPKAQTQQQPQHQAKLLSFDWGNTIAGEVETKHDDAQLASVSPAQEPVHQDLSNNPYLKGIDFSSELPKATMSQVAENSYLKSFNNGDTPKPQAKATVTANDIGNPDKKLTNFNWYD